MVYLSKKHGMPYEEAYQLIRSRRKRAIYHPEWVKMLRL
jgi:murein endopeptidase